MILTKHNLNKYGSINYKKIILNIKENNMKQLNLIYKIIQKMVNIHNINNNVLKNMKQRILKNVNQILKIVKIHSLKYVIVKNLMI